MFNSAPFINEFTKNVANNDVNLQRILHQQPSSTWDQLNRFADKTINTQQIQDNDNLTGRLQSTIDMNPTIINQHINDERQKYNQELLKTSGINTTVSDEGIVEPYRPQPRLIIQQPVQDYVKEPYDMKVKGRVNITEIIIHRIRISTVS